MQLNITPEPKQIIFNSNTTYSINNKLQFDQQSMNDKTIQFLYQNYYKIIFPIQTVQQQSNNIKYINITVKNKTIPNLFDLKENYSIEIKENQINIISENYIALARSFSTLSQIIQYNDSGFYYYVNDIKINDFPQHYYRSFMLDISRHYFGFNDIKQIILALSIMKLNVLHIHLSDDQSFSYESQLEKQNLFQPFHYQNEVINKTYVITQEQLSQLAQYGMLMGVYIVPELESLGHCGSIDQKFTVCGNLAKFSDETFFNYFTQISFEILNLTSLQFNITPVIHYGQDEVQVFCIKQSPGVDKTLPVETILMQYKTKLYNKMTELCNRSVSIIYWEEAFDKSNYQQFSNDTIFEVWMNDGEIEKITKKGFKVIRANGYYLDINVPGRERDYMMQSADDFYVNDLFENETSLVIGGEAPMWSEKANINNLGFMAIERLIALSENTWCSQKRLDENIFEDKEGRKNIKKEVKQRMNQLNCKLQLTNLRPSSLIEGTFCINDEILKNKQLKDYQQKKEYIEKYIQCIQQVNENDINTCDNNQQDDPFKL